MSVWFWATFFKSKLIAWTPIEGWKRFVLPSLSIKALYILSHQDCENIETIILYILFSLFCLNNWRKKVMSSRVLLTSCLLSCCRSIHFVDVQQGRPETNRPRRKKIPGKNLEDLKKGLEYPWTTWFSKVHICKPFIKSLHLRIILIYCFRFMI